MHMRALALPFLVLPGVAAADVTPQDVWDNMVAGYGAFGFEVNAQLDSTGDTLTINDGVASLTYPIIGGQMTATLPPMTLTAVGNGTVQITTPATYASALQADIPEEGEQLSVDFIISQDGFNSIASGNPGDVTYTTSASSLDMLVNNLVVPSEDFGVFELQFDGEGYSSVTTITVADDAVTISNEAANNAAVTTINVDVDGLKQETISNGGALSTSFAAVIPDDTDIMNLAPALRAGLSIVGASESSGGNSVTKSFSGDTMVSEQSQVTLAGTGSFGFDASGIRFEGGSDGGSTTISGADMGLPFPIELGFGAVSANFAFPLLASEDAQAFAYGFSLNEVSVADDIWNLIDPGQGLDRSPISLGLDLSGELLNTLDLVDPATWEQIDDGVVPLEPLSVSINELSVGALGATISAIGAFTFDNTDMQTIPGFPRPEGKASARATGLNAAIDQLVATGLVREDDVMMPRMFMGMFAVAEGNDVLTTEVEINSEGHILLNGQRVQ